MARPPDASPRTPVSNAPRLSEREIDEMQSLLDRVPAPLEPLDVSMLDGFLCGLLVQPRMVPASRWLPHITDPDGRALPRNFDATHLHELVQRRHAELNDAIARRQWFDPWVFELNGLESDAEQPIEHAAGNDEDDGGLPPSSVDAVYPWVAGFATALELFPELMQLGSPALTEPLALLYRHLDADDLEDADDLLEEIETLEPPASLEEAVEDLVRATLLLADVGRPARSPGPAASTRAGQPRSTRRVPPKRH